MATEIHTRKPGRPRVSDEQRAATSQRAQDRYRKDRRISYLLNLARQRAIRKGWDFDLEESDISIPTHCPLLEIELNNYGTNHSHKMSLDRIDSSKGYVKGNVMVVSHRANVLKNNATSAELMLLALNLKEIEDSQ